jgi:CRISPR-associated protein Cas5a/b/c
MRGFSFDVQFHWGFQVRVAGMSKSAPSFLFPPPSTVLGAIAEPYATRRGFSEARVSETLSLMSRATLCLTYKSLNAIPLSFQDVNRVIAIRTSSGVSYPSARNVYGSFDAPARGKTTLSPIGAGEPATLRFLLVVSDSLDLRVEDVWKVKRIGSKESLVTVSRVVEAEPEVLRGEVETDYSLPLDQGVEVVDGPGSYVDQFFVPVEGGALTSSPASLYLESKTKRYRIWLPKGGEGEKAKVRLSGGYVGYRVAGEVAVGVEAKA